MYIQYQYYHRLFKNMYQSKGCMPLHSIDMKHSLPIMFHYNTKYIHRLWHATITVTVSSSHNKTPLTILHQTNWGSDSLLFMFTWHVYWSDLHLCMYLSSSELLLHILILNITKHSSFSNVCQYYLC